MRVLACLLAGVPAIVGFGTAAAGVQRPDQAGGAAGVSHIGLVVRDIARSAEALARMVGTERPTIRPVDHGSAAAPARFAHVRLGNISIELVEPLGTGPGMYRDFLDARGLGVHHLALEKGGSGSLDDHVSRLNRLGGKVIARGDDIVFVDLGSRLGPVVEITSPGGRERLERADTTARRPAGGSAGPDRWTCVTHVGVVVRDIERSRQTYAELTGVEPPPVRQFTAATGTARFTIFNLENVSIELLQQAGDGTGAYADFLGTDAHRIHHLGLHSRGADDNAFGVPEQIAWLERHGGETAINAGGFAYVDFRPRLGVFLEALPEATNSRVYPHPHR